MFQCFARVLRSIAFRAFEFALLLSAPVSPIALRFAAVLHFSVRVLRSTPFRAFEFVLFLSARVSPIVLRFAFHRCFSFQYSVRILSFAFDCLLCL